MQYHPLPALLNFLTPAARSTLKSRSKAMYALSGLLKHNAPAVDALGSLGWTTLRDALQGKVVNPSRQFHSDGFMRQILILPSGAKPYFCSALSSCRTKTARPKPHCPTFMDQNHSHLMTPPHQLPTTRPYHTLTRSPSTPILMPLTFGTRGKHQHHHRRCKRSKNMVFPMPLFLRWLILCRTERMGTRKGPIRISRKKACGKHNWMASSLSSSLTELWTGYCIPNLSNVGEG